MTKFIDICNTEDGKRELVNTELIDSVYIQLPDKLAVCVKWHDRKGFGYDFKEDFENMMDTMRRFYEIKRSLVGNGPTP